METEDKISVNVISDAKDLLRIESQWNALVNKLSINPFLLCEFAKEFIKNIPKGCSPLIIVISNGEEILGIAPLRTRKNIIGRYVDFINPSWCSEFVFDEQYRNICIERTLDYLFDSFNCKFVSFDLPQDSPDFALLKQQCELRRIHSQEMPIMGRRIIPIASTWEEYEAKLEKKFRKKLNKARRKLTEFGLLTKRIDGKEQTIVTEKIYAVENNSWKEKKPDQTGKIKQEQIAILTALQQLTNADAPDFEWGAFFVEIESKTISYVLIIEYKGVTYFVKTSFDEEYRSYSPGLLVQDSAIHQALIERQNRYIDFLSDLPYMKNWTETCFPRTRIQLAKGTLPIMVQSILKNKTINSFISRMFNRTKSPTPIVE